jgi:hypothetical protein
LAGRIIDAGVLMAQPTNRDATPGSCGYAHGRRYRDAHRIIADALPPVLASVLEPGQLELMRQRVLKLPEPERPRLTKRDGVGAMGSACSASGRRFRSVIPPLILIGDARLVLRLSNAVALGLLFVCG